MKVIYRPDIDYVSIDFKNGVEARSFLENGIVVRLDDKENVIGIDITDSSAFFSAKTTISLQEACKLLGVSESTMRRWVKDGKIKYTKPNNKDFRFKKSDILKIIA